MEIQNCSHLCWNCKNSTSFKLCKWTLGIEPKGIKKDSNGNFIYCPNFIPEEQKINFLYLTNMQQAKIFKSTMRTWFRHKSQNTILKFMEKQQKKYNIDISKYNFESFINEYNDKEE